MSVVLQQQILERMFGASAMQLSLRQLDVLLLMIHCFNAPLIGLLFFVSSLVS